MKSENVFNIAFFLTVIGGIGFFGYLFLAEETVSVDVRVEDHRYRNVDGQVVMISEPVEIAEPFGSSSLNRCDPDNAKDFAYVKDGETTFHFKQKKYVEQDSYEFCSPSRTGWMASATFEVDQLQSGIREYPTENLRFYVENVTVR